jgi:hypothetical protein
MLRKIPFLLLLLPYSLSAQEADDNKNAGRFMLGLRTTMSAFSDVGYYGFGTGGQFRLQLGPKLNTEWYYDHIQTDIGGLGRRVDEHIGWSVMYYALGQKTAKGKFTPYVEAGNCFDYTSVRQNLTGGTLVSRGSAAVHLGIGTHFNLSEHADITFKAQYMLHVGSGVEEEIKTDDLTQAKTLVITKGSAAIDGHLLMTCSINFLVADLWKGHLFKKKTNDASSTK